MKVNMELLEKLVATKQGDEEKIMELLRTPLLYELAGAEMAETSVHCNRDGTVSLLGFVNSVIGGLTCRVLAVELAKNGEVSDPRIVDRWW